MWEDLLSELSKFQLPPERIELVKGVLGVQEIGRRLSLDVRGSRLTTTTHRPRRRRAPVTYPHPYRDCLNVYSLDAMLSCSQCLIAVVLLAVHITASQLDLRAGPPPSNICADDGCLRANTIGNACFASVGNVDDPENWEDSPQNAKRTRDCICASEYWSYMAQCRECLKSKNLYPTDLSPDIVTPIAAMSTAYCSPTAGRTDTNTIDGWVDNAAYGANIRLEPITTIPTGSAAAPAPSPFTGLGDDATTVIGASVFASLESAAATETALVSAISVSAATTPVSVSSSSGTATEASTMSDGGSSSTLQLAATGSITSNAAPASTTVPAPSYSSRVVFQLWPNVLSLLVVVMMML
ncbi:MAG: hypothetical protein LQ345_005533 [Seirophora villosa]|nr:MAG: hypothetical protein LQ345_005533 [Seirophora villosa]